ncbi:ABC transporter [Burkholderia sp. Bp8994]|nr:ABC transporter [Burkholderia sp. Bp8994]RQS44197.1 ABC transporter [Burkholderia sp. Bp8990]RQZ49616.1 ABC transporter [Burkholderia sp. Bp9099]
MSEIDSGFKAKRTSLRIFQSVLFALFLREMQTRFGARRMGVVWVVMEPLSILVVILTFYAFFKVSPVQGLDFIIYMVSGIVPFHMMRNISWRMIDAIQANQGLFSYRQVLPFDTFIARMVVEICVYSCAYVIICFFLGFWFDHDVLISDPLAWCLSIAMGIVVAFSIGVLFAIIGHAFPRLKLALRLSYLPIYLTSGVFYPVWRISDEKLSWLAWNPYLEVIDNVRSSMFASYPKVEQLDVFYPIYFSCFALFLSMLLYRWRREDLRKFTQT